MTNILPSTLKVSSLILIAGVLSCPAVAQTSTPVVTPGFTLNVFAMPPSGSSKPDSIAIANGHVWIGYGDGHKPDGSDGLGNEIVEYAPDGSALRTIKVKGHNDGLRLDPYTNLLWAIQNEDANPNLVVIDPVSGRKTLYTFPPSLHGGGYDDVAFVNGTAYLSASNPTLNSIGISTGPAIVSAVLNADFSVTIEPVLAGHTKAVNIPFGFTTTVNLTDPDSMLTTERGDILMTDQGDAQLVLFKRSTASEPTLQVLPMLGGVQVDDTTVVTSNTGYLLISDTGGNVTYKLTAKAWGIDDYFSASTGVPVSGTTPAIPAYVGRLDIHSGGLFPAVTNLVAPHGVVFVAQ